MTIKFWSNRLVWSKFGKSASETSKMVKKAYGGAGIKELNGLN